MSKHNLILVRGLPGSGKSTFAKMLAGLIPNSHHVEADMWMSDYSEKWLGPHENGYICPHCDADTDANANVCFNCGEKIAGYRFDPKKLSKAHEKCLRFTKRKLYMEQFGPDPDSVTVIVSNTFVRESDLMPYYSLVLDEWSETVRQDFQITVVTMNGGKSDWLLAERNTKGVPLHTITKYRKLFDHDPSLVTDEEYQREHLDRMEIEVGDDVSTPDYQGAVVVKLGDGRVQVSQYDARDGGYVEIWYDESQVTLIKKVAR